MAESSKNGGPNHLKAWRVARGMTLEALGAAIEPPVGKQTISAWESGQNGLKAKVLRRLAPALRTTPGYLLDYDPSTVDLDWAEAIAAVPITKRPQAIKHLRALAEDKAA